jgi:hypothetical protein
MAYYMEMPMPQLIERVQKMLIGLAILRFINPPPTMFFTFGGVAMSQHGKCNIKLG